MKLTGTIISIGRHNRDGEAIDGVLIGVPREQLQQGGILYRDVVVHPDYHAKVENPEVFNVDLLEKRIQLTISAGDRLDLLLRCEAGIEDIKEWACATREQQLAMISEAQREWRKRREG